ncbi:MAG: 4-alpha-glucanotransferase [Clostridiales bacterium]|jgi:4-alpha-glucanotransferase|nr:4-alpha-glucanotransferase [Clostridiales bacterium]
MELIRSGGVLAHPTSFPGPYGVGDLGSGAYAFIDFLRKAGQTLWQILPLSPTSYGDSPYQSFSAFAGNHYLISPEMLIKEGYLAEADAEPFPGDPSRIDYGEVIPHKMAIYRKAYASFKQKAKNKNLFTRWCGQNKDWLESYALFVAIKQHYIDERRDLPDPAELEKYRAENAAYLTGDQINDFYYGAVWNSWQEPLARHEPAAVREMAKRLSDEIDFHKFLQYEFFREWRLLKEYANENGIGVVGDIPIFVAMDSADVWAEPGLYHLDEYGRPKEVAGVPPDYFSETGQLWGNPLYHWEAHKKSGYEWWIKRVASVLKTVDAVRIDHFRGFEAYWAVPYGEKTAVNGKWKKGPGKDLFDAMKKKLGELPIIAEDLGVITEKVNRLRKGLKLPGMRVLHFAFSPDGKNAFMPHNIDDTDTVIYTGTHDNDTTVGWYAAAPEAERDYLRRYLNVSGEDVAWDLIRLAYSSTAKYAVVPVQDVLNLGTEHRMNYPGEPSGNWQFRYTAGMLTEEHAERLAYLSQLYNRKPANAILQ